jgi:hypothetical protein
VDSVHEARIKKELDDILDDVQKSKFYSNLTPQQLQYLMTKFIQYARKAYLAWDLPEFNGGPVYPHLMWHDKDALKAVEQVWKRKIYFKVFHKKVTNMDELKEAALYSFWVLKLHPFYRQPGNVSSNKFNAAMALYILYNGLAAFVADMNKKETKALRADPNYKIRRYSNLLNKAALPGLLYSFQFRDWSKEAIMDLAESLIDIK